MRVDGWRMGKVNILCVRPKPETRILPHCFCSPNQRAPPFSLLEGTFTDLQNCPNSYCPSSLYLPSPNWGKKIKRKNLTHRNKASSPPKLRVSCLRAGSFAGTKSLISITYRISKGKDPRTWSPSDSLGHCAHGSSLFTPPLQSAGGSECVCVCACVWQRVGGAGDYPLVTLCHLFSPRPRTHETEVQQLASLSSQHRALGNVLIR